MTAHAPKVEMPELATSGGSCGGGGGVVKAGVFQNVPSKL